MKRTLIIANWKMHLNTSQASLLLHRLHERIKIHRDVEVVLAPSMLTLQPLSQQIDRRKFRLAAQNAHYRDEGAFTGEVSFTMLHDLVHYVIIGHSERRLFFHEDLDVITQKMAAAVRNHITPVLCVGETHQERLDGESRQVVHDQLVTALSGLTSQEVRDVVITYEPVWAISTFNNELAKPSDVSRMLEYIRNQIAELYSARTAKAVRVLYGGSVNDHTVGGYLDIDGCDGVLVGGASLNYHSFSEIVHTAYRRTKQKGNKN
jgi:triosephosphate isomerase (TIM)